MLKSCLSITVTTAALVCSTALALNKNNAGPTDFELKFKLPPPAAQTPDEALKSFAIEKGYRIELVAAEPLVEAPIAISFDDQGRLYVVEMRGYMHDVAGSTESEPTGRIKLLEDTDGDGRMDKATIFMDELVMPRSVMAVNGGVLVAVPPQLLFCKDTDGDDKADVREVVADDYGTLNGQPEHMANSPVWAMDNWVWSANYNARFRYRNGVWQKDSGLGRGQYGLCQDDAGRLYYNYNSDFLRCDLLPTEAFNKNALLRNASSINWQVIKVQTIWPSHPTPGVNRGYDKSLREDGTLKASTATCGALIYRGDGLPAGSKGNAFIPEPAGNLVKRLLLEEKDGIVTAKNATWDKDFLTSTDERFRPVQAADGPDGGLYIVDMYRGIIQHSSFLTHYLIKNIEDRKLSQPVNMGRIWRVVPDTGDRKAAFKIPADTAGRVAALKHENGWVRDTAQRLLVEAGGTEAVAGLTALLKDSTLSAVTRLQALWTLEGVMALTPDVLKTALKDGDKQIRAAAVRMAGRDLTAELGEMSKDPEALVRAQLAIKLASFAAPDTDTLLADLLAKGSGKQALVREGAFTGLRGREAGFVKTLLTQTQEPDVANVMPVLEQAATLIAASNKAQPFVELFDLLATQKPGSAVQVALLKGLSNDPSGSAKKDKSSTPKLLWLEKQPEKLVDLKTSLIKYKSSALKTLEAVEARIAWPGKPGAPPPPKIVPLSSAQQALFDKGKVVYQTLCAACHQPHGMGLDGLAPGMVDSEWVIGKPDVPARIIMHGLVGPIKVGSRTWDLAMPPLPHLTDEDIAAVLTYIRREWDHTASPVDTAAVKAIRDKHADRVQPWTAAELKKSEKK